MVFDKRRDTRAATNGLSSGGTAGAAVETAVKEDTSCPLSDL